MSSSSSNVCKTNDNLVMKVRIGMNIAVILAQTCVMLIFLIFISLAYEKRIFPAVFPDRAQASTCVNIFWIVTLVDVVLTMYLFLPKVTRKGSCTEISPSETFMILVLSGANLAVFLIYRPVFRMIAEQSPGMSFQAIKNCIFGFFILQNAPLVYLSVSTFGAMMRRFFE